MNKKNIIKKWMPIIDILFENKTNSKKESLCEYAEQHALLENEYKLVVNNLNNTSYVNSTLPISLKILSQINTDTIYIKKSNKNNDKYIFEIKYEPELFGDTENYYTSELIKLAVDYINNNIQDKKLYTSYLVSSITKTTEINTHSKIRMVCDFSLLN